MGSGSGSGSGRGSGSGTYGSDDCSVKEPSADAAGVCERTLFSCIAFCKFAKNSVFSSSV